MNSRLALSALFTLIAAMVIGSQGTGLLEKLNALRSSCANTISEVPGPAVLDHPTTAGNQRRVAGTISPDAKAITFNFTDATHCLGSRARHLQRFVLNLIDSDHRGE